MPYFSTNYYADVLFCPAVAATPTPTVTATPTATPTPPPIDSDGDGCTDEREAGPEHTSGGDRDPLNHWDFFDVPAPALSPAHPNSGRNKVVTLADVLAILSYVGTVHLSGPNANDLSYDTDLNGNGVLDGAEYDRAPSTTQSKPWRSGPPSGAVTLQDALVALAQVGDNCR